MRKTIAKILYFFMKGRVRSFLKCTDSILAVYGHNQKQKPFEEWVQWMLSNEYQFITPTELFEYINGEKKVEGRIVWLSFDDGWRGNYDEVFPILKKYEIPATIFVATKGISDGYYWFTQVFQNRDSKLCSAVDELWTMNNAERVSIIKQLPHYRGERCTMNENEITEMSKSGLVYWGNHTHDHVMSDKCTNEELAKEIEMCSKIMKEITGSDCDYIFSYPNGNYDNRTEDILKQFGFKMAATTNMALVKCPSNPYMIPRFEIKNGCLEENILQCFGIWTNFFDSVKKVLGIKNTK